jgi:hypothetical protein
MSKLILSGWNPGFNKIGLTKLLQVDLGYSLSHAKAITDSVLEGQSIAIDLDEDQFEQMGVKLSDLCTKFVLEKDTEVQSRKLDGRVLRG